MILAMSYETAQRIDNNFSNTILILVIIILFIACIAAAMLDTMIIPIILAFVIVGVEIYGSSKTSNVETVIKQQLPNKQNKLETLKTKRLELVQQKNNTKKLKQINQQITKLQITINHYNSIINNND